MPDHELTVDELLGGGPNARIENPYALYRRLRSEQPVLEVAGGFGTRLITRFADVERILKDDERFSSRSNGDRGIALVMGRTIIGMDGKEHLKHRALITPELAPRALRGDFPKLVEQTAHDLIDRFATSGRADLVADFTFQFPLRVFIEILGLPPDEVDAFHRWAVDLTHVASDPARGLAASADMKDYLAKLVAVRRDRPADDLVSKLAHARVDGQQLSEEEVISFIRLLVIAGAETSYHLMGSALFALLSAPELLAAVQADRTLLEPVLVETLRWESPVQILTREVREDTVLSGTRIPAGTDIIVCIGSANRDETRFPDPDRFDIERQAETHIAFGFGKHYCAGSRLALLEASVGLNALLDRLPGVRFDPEATPASVVGFAFRSPDQLRVRFGS